MPDQPLRPFSPPDLAQLHLSGLISPGVLVTWVLYAIFAFWAIYTLVAIYHWLKYSHASLIAFPAIALHLAVSFSLMSYVLFGNALFLSPFLS